MRIDIANRLADIRRERGYSQEALAAELGVSRQAVSKWERAESSPDTDNLIALADLYGLSLDQLIRGEVTTAPTGKGAEDAPELETAAEPTDSVEEGAQTAVEAEKPAVEKPTQEWGRPGRHRRSGDQVHVSWRGIHVIEEDGSEVYVGPGGIHVSESHAGVPSHWHHRWSRWDGLVVLLSLVGLLTVGFLTPWGWGWAVCCLLVMPLWSSACKVADASAGAGSRCAIRELWTVAVLAIFVVLGLGCGLWHPGWAVLLLIPIGQLVMSLLWDEFDRREEAPAK